MKDIYFLFF